MTLSNLPGGFCPKGILSKGGFCPKGDFVPEPVRLEQDAALVKDRDKR